MLIQPNSTILFQGDSITDAGRNRENAQPNMPAALGSGYCNQIAARLLHERAGDNLQFYNRGISGNRVVDLYARWKSDALNLQPDLISILIGVNDTWHEFMYGNGVEVARYAAVYRMLLDFTRQELPTVQLVLCELFVLPCGVVEAGWVAEIEQRRAVVRELAAAYDALFVPCQAALDAVLTQAPPAYWAHDGVHPTPAGHHVLAECWVETVLGSA